MIPINNWSEGGKERRKEMSLASCLMSLPVRNLSLSHKQGTAFSKVGGMCPHKKPAGDSSMTSVDTLLSFDTSLTGKIVILMIYLQVC